MDSMIERVARAVKACDVSSSTIPCYLKDEVVLKRIARAAIAAMRETSRCENCKFYKEGSCEHPKFYFGYRRDNDHLKVNPDGLIIENDEGWGWQVGPRFGCIHFEAALEDDGTG